MAVYEEQARFLVAKYGTAQAVPGHAAWSPTTVVVFTPEALMVLAGLVLFAVILFLVVRDLLDARERRERAERAYYTERETFFDSSTSS